MIGYFLKSNFRHLLRHRSYSLIGILSLSVGITVLLMIAIYTSNEFNIDRFHTRAAQIYKVSYGNSSFTPGPLTGELLTNFPEIENATHIEIHQLFAFSPVLNFDNQSFEIERYYSVDTSFLRIFDFEVLQGDPNTALSQPFSIILTQSEARRIFKSQDPIGQTVTWRIYRDFPFTVTAVVRDPPRNSSIRFNGLISGASLGKMGRHYHDDWGYTSFESYLLLVPGTDAGKLEQKLRKYLIEYYAANLSTRPCHADASANPLELHALRKVYFAADLANDTTNRGNLLLIRILIAVGIVIMLLSIINYINLFVAKAMTRAKETGIQKVCGSSNSLLIVHYLTETIVTGFIAAIVGSVATLILLPWFSRFMDIDQGLKLSVPAILVMIPGILLTGTIAGIYPAFVMSSRNIAAVLKNQTARGSRGPILRHTLIIFQFSISMIMIACTLIINKQLIFIKNDDLGITRENVMYLKLPFQIMRGNPELFRNQVMDLSGVDNVSFSSTVFGQIENINTQEIGGKTVSFSSIWTDDEFVDLYNIKLSEGRVFSREFGADVNTTALLNETAVKKFDVRDPYRIRIKVPGGEARVVGIVRDFNFTSLHNPIEPLVIVYLPSQAGYVNIKLSGADLQGTVDRIEKIWNNLAPGFPFNYQFLDSGLAMQYRDDERTGRAIMYFSVVAMLIALLGIFGISMFILEKRSRETGIHKVFGAKLWNLQFLLNKNFLIVLGISFVIACPAAWYFMHVWLERFAYRTDMGPGIYILSGLLVALFTLSVVGMQSRHYARRNPIDVLRYE